MSEETDRWTLTYVGLGSNLGDREKNLRGALSRLGGMDAVEVLRVSKFHETEPVGGPPQGAFLNAAAEAATSLPPRQFLQTLHRVEDAFGREREVRWGPRTLDLDLLLYGGRIIDEPDITVPHPRMHTRRFVLEPLCELCPDRTHPRLGTTMRRLLAKVDDED